VVLPVRPQLVEELVREGHRAVAAALPAADPQEAAGRVEVGHPEVGQLAQPQPAPVGDAEHQPVASGRDGGEEAADLGRGEDDGEGPGLPGERDERDDLGPAEDVSVEEPEGAGGLVEPAPGGGGGDEVELVVAEVVGGELVGRSGEVAGGVGDAGDVRLDGAGGVVAAGQLVDQPAAERGPGSSSGGSWANDREDANRGSKRKGKSDNPRGRVEPAVPREAG
jgi:hypothetical protein